MRLQFTRLLFIEIHTMNIVHSQRVRAVQLLYTSLQSKPYHGDNLLQVAREIESAIYFTAYQQQCDYLSKTLQLAWSCKLRGVTIIDDIDVFVLPLMSDETLAHGTEVEQWWKSHDEKLEQQRKLLHEEAKFQEGEQVNFGSLICNRCHSRSISVQQQQIRSADEGMTVFCTCTKCNMRWKM